MNNPYLEQKWTLRTALGRAGTILRDEGASSFFFKVVGELFYRRLLVSELRFDQVDLTKTFGGHDLVTLAPSAFAGYLKFRGDLDQRQIDDRLRRGHECHAILIDGEVAQSSWVASGDSARVGYLDCEIELGPRDIYVYEFLVHPSHRGRKLFPAALSRLVTEYRRRGYERIIWAAMPENTRAIAATRHWPFHPLGTLGYWKIAAHRKYFTSIPESSRPPHFSSDHSTQWHRQTADRG